MDRFAKFVHNLYETVKFGKIALSHICAAKIERQLVELKFWWSLPAILNIPLDNRRSERYTCWSIMKRTDLCYEHKPVLDPQPLIEKG